MTDLIIHIYVVCWNEQTILPHFLRHYAFADKIIVLDNGSTDRSIEIAKAHQYVTIEPFDSNNEFNDQININLKNSVWKKSRNQADFVIVCDCDELLYHPDLLSSLQYMKSIGKSVLKPRGYDMIGDRIPAENESIYEVIPNGVRNYMYDKCLLFNPNLVENINYCIGSHICEPEGEISYYRSPNWKLLHFKYLSPDYMYQRYKTLEKRLSQFNNDNNYAQTYKHSEQRIRETFKQLLQRSKPICLRESKPESTDQDLELIFKHGIQLLQQKKFEEAIEYLDYVLMYQPDHVMGLANMGLILQHQGLIDDAQFLMQQALALETQIFDIWFNFGNLLFRTNRIKNAKYCYTKTLSLNQDFQAAKQQIIECDRLLSQSLD